MRGALVRWSVIEANAMGRRKPKHVSTVIPDQGLSPHLIPEKVIVEFLTWQLGSAHLEFK